MEEPCRAPRDAARERKRDQQQYGNDGKNDAVRVRGLEFQDGEFGQPYLIIRIVARVGGHAAHVQLDRMAVIVERLVITKRVDVDPESLHQQEREHDAPDQRAAARGSK